MHALQVAAIIMGIMQIAILVSGVGIMMYVVVLLMLEVMGK